MRTTRLCSELGADIVTVNWSGDKESFSDIVKVVVFPVVVAGGSQIDNDAFIRRMAEAVSLALGGKALHILGEVEPGIPVFRLFGDFEIRIVIKAGGFRTPHALIKAMAAIKGVVSVEN